MNIVALIVGGMLLGWFLEWLYVYVTKTAPKKNAIKQLEAALQNSEQKQSEITAEMSVKIEALKAQVDELNTRNETVVAEADSLREELAVVQQSIELEQSGAEEVEFTDAASELDSDAKLEEEFTQALEADLPEPVTSEDVDVVVKEAVVKDDMTQLIGVGPKTAELLNEAGLVSFTQLAAMDVESLHEFLQTHNIPHSKTKSTNWPEQAGSLKSSLK